MLRRSEILSRIGNEAPCLLCHLPARNLSADAAFLMPMLAQAVWDSPKLGNEAKIAVNDALSSFLRCCDGITRVMSPSVVEDILRVVAPDAQLVELCKEFINLSFAPVDGPTAGSTID